MPVAHAEIELAQIQEIDARLMETINGLEKKIAELKENLKKNGERSDQLRIYIKLDHELSVKYGNFSEQPSEGSADNLILSDPIPKRAVNADVRSSVRSKTSFITQAAEAILKEHKDWMHTKDLIDIMRTKGVQINSAHVNNYVSNILSRSTMFMNNRNFGWRLREVSSEPSSLEDSSLDTKSRKESISKSIENSGCILNWRDAAE